MRCCLLQSAKALPDAVCGAVPVWQWRLHGQLTMCTERSGRCPLHATLSAQVNGSVLTRALQAVSCSCADWRLFCGTACACGSTCACKVQAKWGSFVVAAAFSTPLLMIGTQVHSGARHLLGTDQGQLLLLW